jgi:hypothetical protein
VQFCHRRDDGLSASPVAGPPPQNASLVRLFAPIEFLSVYWSAVSEGKPPILPSYKSFNGLNGNRLFLRGERCGIVTPSALGHIWMAAGVYEYSVPATEDLDSVFVLSKCPWEGTPTDVARDFYVPVQNFVVGLFNPFSTLEPGEVLDPDVPRLQAPIG